MPQAAALPTTDPRAQILRHRFHGAFAAPELPVPIESIAADLLGLYVEEAEIDYSGLLIPAERRIVLRAGEPQSRQRFTLAHEVGHWVCQVKEGHKAPVYCRAADVAPSADRLLEREANVFAAELLMPEPAVRAVWREFNDVAACATRFDVSLTAMQWRLFAFDLVADRPVSEPVPGRPTSIDV
jgi:Zn-dependent peptidase ImmA (M78 family)